MKSFFKHILAITLALIVLFTTFSFSVNMHYCGDILIDTAVFGKAESCGIPLKKCSITKIDCCNEKQFVATGQDELKASYTSFMVENQLFIGSFMYISSNSLKVFYTLVNTGFNYITPLVVKDIQLLDEVYLI